MAITLTQIATWLDEAVQAKHDLVTGQAIVRVNGPSAQVEFFHATDAGAIACSHDHPQPEARPDSGAAGVE